MRSLLPSAALVSPALALLLPLWACTAATRAASAPQARPVATAPAEPVLASEAVGQVTLLLTGDLIPHGAVKEVAQAEGGFGALLAPLGPTVAAADLAFVNLETPVAPRADQGSRSFVFNAPPDLLAGLKQAGFDVVLFANNHVYDQGPAGLAESLGELERSGLAVLGAGRTLADARAPRRFEVHGVKLAWFGAAQFFNMPPSPAAAAGEPQAALLDEEALTQAIRHVRPEVDAVLVSLHWGVEYAPAPRPQEAALAHRLMDAGVDVIVGSHPHVLQPVEFYRTADGRMAACLYSLGNFLSNQSRLYVPRASAESVGDTRDEVLVQLSLVKRRYGEVGTRVDIEAMRYMPLWMENTYYRPPGALLDIHPVLIDDELARLEQARLALEAVPHTPATQLQAIALRDRIELLTARRARIFSRLGEEFSGR
jgi:poly-gamma-glutamate synthesis protein (capsule biosynthesis protein)